MYGEIFSSLRRQLQDRDYSEGYAESFLNAYIATQIKVIREQRELTQAQLGERIGTTQAGISRYEDVNYSSWSLRTLIRLARAFDVRLKVSFEPYGTLPDEVLRFERNRLERVSRENDPALTDVVENAKVSNIEIWKALNPSVPRQENTPTGTNFEAPDLGGSVSYASSGNS